MLYRKIEPYIEEYLTKAPDKILCIDGAGQVGKTVDYIKHQFLDGRIYYDIDRLTQEFTY